MNIIKISLIPYKSFITNFTKYLNSTFLIFLVFNVIFLLYSNDVLNRIFGSSNIDTIFIINLFFTIYYIFIALLLTTFAKKIFITTVNIHSFNHNTNLKDKNYHFRYFITSVLCIVLCLILSALFLNYSDLLKAWYLREILFILIIIMFPGYFIIAPSFILIEGYNKNYIENILAISSLIKKSKLKIAFIFIIVFLFFLLIILLSQFVFIFIILLIITTSYNILNSLNGNILTISAFFIGMLSYIAFIIYANLSIILYLKLKNNTLFTNQKD